MPVRRRTKRGPMGMRRTARRRMPTRTARTTVGTGRTRRTKTGIRIKEWTAADITLLRKQYKSMTNTEIARMMKRSSGSIRAKAALLGLRNREDLPDHYANNLDEAVDRSQRIKDVGVDEVFARAGKAEG